MPRKKQEVVERRKPGPKPGSKRKSKTLRDGLWIPAGARIAGLEFGEDVMRLVLDVPLSALSKKGKTP